MKGERKVATQKRSNERQTYYCITVGLWHWLECMITPYPLTPVSHDIVSTYMINLLLEMPVCIMTSLWPLTPVILACRYRANCCWEFQSVAWPSDDQWRCLSRHHASRWEGPAAGIANQYYDLCLTLAPYLSCHVWIRGTCCWECQSVLWPQFDPWPLFILSCMDERETCCWECQSVLWPQSDPWPLFILSCIDERDLLLGGPISIMTLVWPLTPVYLVMYRWEGPAAGSASQYYDLSLTLDPCLSCHLWMRGTCCWECQSVLWVWPQSDTWPVFILSCIDERDLLLGVPVSIMTSVWPLTPVYLVMYRSEGPAAGSASQYYDLSLTLDPCLSCHV